MNERIILVDLEDNIVGVCEKLHVHREAILHRAFSIFIFNSRDELLIHKRARTKYHSPNLWTNTCCSHQREGKLLREEVHEGLKYEMGFNCPLEGLFKFHYKATFSNGLTENEIDYVFTGVYDGVVKPNLDEVLEFKWINLKDLRKDVMKDPAKYTPWFKIILDKTNYFEKAD